MNYKAIYEKIIERAFSRTLPKSDFTEKHHVIPKCLGGSNDKSNLAVLTRKEHYICHLLLLKIYNNASKKIRAMLAGAVMLLKRRINSPTLNLAIEILRKKAIERNKPGPEHPSFGNVFYKCNTTKEVKRFKRGYQPDGWEISRSGGKQAWSLCKHKSSNDLKFFRPEEIPEDFEQLFDKHQVKLRNQTFIQYFKERVDEQGYSHNLLKSFCQDEDFVRRILGFEGITVSSLNKVGT